jgi:hypothetical protein
MNAQILIHAVVQQTMVFIAQLATAGGVRAPLASIANQVLLDLTNELQNQGVRKNVIADMFGMTLRTYHRRVSEVSQSRSVEGRSVWEAVLEFVRANEPISAGRVHQRFTTDERDVVAGVLNDLVGSGICYRSGRGMDAVYRTVDASDFATATEGARETANEYLVWQAVYRGRPISRHDLIAQSRMPEASCDAALARLLEDGRVVQLPGTPLRYTSTRLEVMVGQSHGWEAAVFDHFQATVSAVGAKLVRGVPRSETDDLTGGATYHLDLNPNLPVAQEALGTLRRMRLQLDDLRARIDDANARSGEPPTERLIVYVGQHLLSDREELEGDE